jgi:hypothetical protein
MVLWLASSPLAGSRMDRFEVILHIEDSTKNYQTLILDIGPGDTPEPVITIGFPSDF